MGELTHKIFSDAVARSLPQNRLTSAFVPAASLHLVPEGLGGHRLPAVGAASVQTGVVLAVVVEAVGVLGEVGSHAAARTRHLGGTRLVGCKTQWGFSTCMVTVTERERERVRERETETETETESVIICV